VSASHRYLIDLSIELVARSEKPIGTATTMRVACCFLRVTAATFIVLRRLETIGKWFHLFAKTSNLPQSCRLICAGIYFAASSEEAKSTSAS
jgi:hypothetical protein